ALALDPLSPRTNGLALWTMFMAGQYKEAEDLARKQPRGSSGGPGLLARALSLEGRHAEAKEAIDIAVRMGYRDWNPACVATRAGGREDALAELQAQLTTGKVPRSRRLFLIYACLGDKARVLKFGEEMFAEHEPLLPTFLTYPETAWLRKDS